ncbi:MAG: hypothetical protein M1821_000666 [Bathelium mastoideum]|nr:MAG: hypothetical protein M1821_000666 [Bathelium mastoideum]
MPFGLAGLLGRRKRDIEDDEESDRSHSSTRLRTEGPGPLATISDVRSASSHERGSTVNRPINDARNIGLRPLYTPEDGKAVVDIIFVHGLTGNAYSTWHFSDKKTDVYWPYDILRKDHPDARIAAFGYDADVTQFWGPASSNRVGNHAENLLGSLSRLRAKTKTVGRKIVFVVHSLGGLVTENALTLSRASPEDDIRSIERDTMGIAFLGTPHHGSDYAAWVTFASNMTKWIKGSNKNIVAVLQPDSEVLANIQKGFDRLLSIRSDAGNKIRVVCFYEELPVVGLGDDMTKFESSQDPGYEAVEGEIFKWIESVRPSMQQALIDSGEEVQEFLQSLEFQGMSRRVDTIDQSYPGTLHWIWSRSHVHFKNWLRSGTGIFWASGKAGSGKSTLMKHLRDSSKMFDELRSHELDTGQTRTVIIAACFLDYSGNAFAKSIEGLLRTILFHVLSQHNDLFQHIRRTFRNLNGRSNDRVTWTFAALERCFFELVHRSSHARFMLLVDALDEYAGEDSEIATFLTHLSESSSQNLQICASSRPHVDFEEQFGSCARLRMERETEHDIREYVQGQFRAFIDRHGSSYAYLVDDIVSNSRGLFVWVKLACIEILRAARRGEDIEMLSKRLKSMPEELDDFYQRILDLLDPEERQEAHAMLAITIASNETFTPVQLRYVIHFATGRYAEFNDFFAETRILAVCGGFLEFEERETVYQAQGVRLAHRTVHHFLEVSHPSLLQSRNPDGKRITGEVLISDACIEALMQVISKSSKRTGSCAENLCSFGKLIVENELASFYTYALKQWLARIIVSEAKTCQAQSSLRLLEGSMFEKWRLIAQSEADVRATIFLNNANYSITKHDKTNDGTLLRDGGKWLNLLVVH